jgi:hypothetical protein
MGITSKYWLAAVAPGRISAADVRAQFRVV